VRKSWIVARYEFTGTVKRAWFLVSTFLVPLVFAGVAGGMSSVARQAVEESQAAVRGKPMGYVDLWGELDARRGFERYAGEDEARRALVEKRIGSYLVVPKDYLDHGRVRVATTRRPTLLTAEQPPLPPGVRDWLMQALLKGVDPARIRRAREPLLPELVTLDASGQPSSEDAAAVQERSLAAYGFFLLLFTSIFTSSAYLLQGMAEEKEHRVMEMILSSISPAELMLGKLVGLGAAGMLQLAIWIGMGVVSLLFFAVQFALSPLVFVFCGVYFLLGYVLFGTLMLGFGALGTNLRESQQMASIWSFLGASPALILVALLEAPQGTVARVFSYIPFTAPTTMMFRYAIDPKGTPWIDIAASLLLLAASTGLALKGSARLYRAGLLLYGKRPGVREILRWLRAAD
jgi:ABC-2 type transport system permease protein